MGSDKQLRSPICSVLGHVDHGKSSLLDAIRGTAIVNAEPGMITQAIGASIIPLETIFSVAGSLLDPLKGKVNVPGLLFIDTPGHAAFTSLRKRGGSLADLAIVVVDINEGLKPQSLEAIDILRASKTPFIIAANKIDLVPGWHSEGKPRVLGALDEQSADVLERVETRLYELVGRFHELGFESERFDRVTDYARQVVIVPMSAKTHLGIPELLMVLIGLAQRFLEQRLHLTMHDGARGVILEVKEDKGHGRTIDVILHDGILRKSDIILTPTTDEVIRTHARALLEPMPLAEMRDRKAAYRMVPEAVAATGVKISAPNLDRALAGMPIVSLHKEDETRIAELQAELASSVAQVLVDHERDGLIIKADTIGSLEALSVLCKERGWPIRRAAIGTIARKDVLSARSVASDRPEYGCVLGFNVRASEDAREEARSHDLRIITSDIVYKIIDDYEVFLADVEKERKRDALEGLTRPFRLRILPGYIFRQSNPAIVGCIVERGSARTGAPIMKNGRLIGKIKSIQKDKENVTETEEGSRAAFSIERAVVGRSIFEDDVLFSAVTEEEFRTYKSHKEALLPAEKEVLTEIAHIQRESEPLWGV